MRIGLDIGYGYIKSINEKGEKVRFPNAYEKLKEEDKLPQLQEIDYHVSINENGQKVNYIVGDRAAYCAKPKDLRKDMTLNQEALKVFIGTTAFLLTDGRKEQHIDLSVGLPIDFYKKQHEELKALLTGMTINIEIGGKTKNIIVDTLMISQQGLGAFFALVYDIDGNLLQNYDDRLQFGCGIIDIGYNTIDYMFIERMDGKFIIKSELSGSKSMGIHIAHEDLTAMLNRKMGKTIEVENIENKIHYNDKRIPIGSGKEAYDFSEDYEESMRNLGDKILKTIVRIWSYNADDLGVLYLTGGGAIPLMPHMSSEFERIAVQDDNNFANAKGYLVRQALSWNKEAQKKSTDEATEPEQNQSPEMTSETESKESEDLPV